MLQAKETEKGQDNIPAGDYQSEYYDYWEVWDVHKNKVFPYRPTKADGKVDTTRMMTRNGAMPINAESWRHDEKTGLRVGLKGINGGKGESYTWNEADGKPLIAQLEKASAARKAKKGLAKTASVQPKANASCCSPGLPLS